MNIRNWITFEKEFGLQTIFKGYIGGFVPKLLCKIEEKTILNKLLYGIVSIFNRVFGKKYKFLNKFNSEYFSGFAMGIYKKPSN